jgi:hypothetical protein
VITAAASAAHTGLALQRRITKSTSTANGTATSAIRKSPGPPLIRSINCGASGVNTPDSTPPAAIISRLLREVLSEVIACVNAHLVSSSLERAKGIEPSYAAWETVLTPLSVNRLHRFGSFLAPLFLLGKTVIRSGA